MRFFVKNYANFDDLFDEFVEEKLPVSWIRPIETVKWELDQLSANLLPWTLFPRPNGMVRSSIPGSRIAFYGGWIEKRHRICLIYETFQLREGTVTAFGKCVDVKKSTLSAEKGIFGRRQGLTAPYVPPNPNTMAYDCRVLESAFLSWTSPKEVDEASRSELPRLRQFKNLSKFMALIGKFS